MDRTLTGQELVDTARAIAVDAHADQQDKAGAPYIGHPARVAGRLDDDVARAVAWLHDVLEDTPVTEDDLHRAGFPAEVVATVRALTRRDDEPLDDHLARVRAHGELAVRVKLADVADNADPTRLARLEPATRARLEAKYARTRAALDRG
jgi:(p)ppGpp synthase/HD superfamily hydrolase